MRLAILCVLAATTLPAQTVEGRVLNDLTGAPVAGVQITLYPKLGQAPPSAPLRSKSDADGRFQIAGVPEGVYTPRYTCTGYFEIPGPGGPRGAFAVSALTKDPVHLEVKMQPTAKISGRVLDSEGNPVALADIWLLRTDRYCKPPACFPYSEQVRAWTDGTYNVNDLPVSGGWLLAAKLGGGSVRGALESCGNANILLVPQEPVLRRAGFMRQTNCDPKGKFAFDAVRPGAYYAFATTRTGPILSYTGELSDPERIKQATKVTVRDHESTTVEVRLVY